MSQSQFNVSHFTVHYTYGETIELTPFGDVHWETDLCSRDHWREFIFKEKEKISKGVKTLYIGMGDYQDFLSDSERFALVSSKWHETSKKEVVKNNRLKVDAMLEDLSFMKGRLIGMHEGNHYFDFPEGMTSTQYMCKQLECKYLGGTAFHRISFDSDARDNLSVDIFSAHHGTGGRLLGSSITSLQRMAEVATADIYIQAHNHQRSGLVTAKPMFLNKNCILKARKMVLCNSGSFLKAYVDGEESYAVKRWMRPTDLGTITILIKPMRSQTKNLADRYADLKVLT